MQSIRVFLADDHAVLRHSLRCLLEIEPDITVVGDAANGRQAVAQVEALHPDVVLMDIAMPDLNGIEATARIHQAWPTVRVIILSMYSTAEFVFRALQAGARGYLLKESAGAEVIQALHQVQAGHRYLSQMITETVITDYLRKRSIGPESSPLENLTPREREILQLVAEGKSSAEIAAILSLSVKTVENHRTRIGEKLGIHNLPGLTKFAIQHGLTSL